MVSDYYENSLVKEPIETGFSPLIEKRQERPAFIPRQHPTRQHYSEHPVAFVNCGFYSSDAGSTTNVSYLPANAPYFSLTDAFVRTNYPVDGHLNPLLSDVPKSHRHCNGTLTYKVQLPKKDRYDVTLVFACIYDSFLGEKLCVFNVEVTGVHKHLRPDLDVFSEVGAYRPFIISFTNVEAEDFLEISLTRGTYGTYTYINGFVVEPCRDGQSNSLIPDDIVTIYDCGDDYPNLTPPHVKIYPAGSISGSRYTAPITCESPTAAGFSKRTRHTGVNTTFGYDITVPHPGRYDVSVCLSEVHSATSGVRVQDLTVQGLDVFCKKNLDIASEVGLNHPYILSCLNMRVDDVVKIRSKGLKREPVLNGFAVTKATEFPTNPADDPLSIITVNCGTGGSYPEYDTGLSSNGEYIGTTSTYHPSGYPMLGVIGEDEMFRLMGMSHRVADEVSYKFRPRTSGLGNYDVAVVLCEVYNSSLAVGKRVFSLEVKGSFVQKVDNIDIFKRVGGYRTLVLRFPNVELEGGEFLTVSAKKTSSPGKAIINGIFIVPSIAKHPLMQEPVAPIAFVNCAPLGAPATLFGGAGENVSGKYVYKYNYIRATGTGLLADICSRYCYGNFDFAVGVDVPGNYDVFLFFAEQWTPGDGKRVFTVEVMGREKIELADICVFKEVGMYAPLVMQVRGLEADKNITITGLPKLGYPILSGFVIYKSGTLIESTMPSFLVNELYDEKYDC